MKSSVSRLWVLGKTYFLYTESTKGKSKWTGVTWIVPDQLKQFSYKNNVFQFNVLNHNGHNIWMNFPHSSNKPVWANDNEKDVTVFYFSVKSFALLQGFINVWFQKLSIPAPWKGFSLDPPPLWKFQSSFIHLLKFGAFENPTPPTNFQPLLWGE